MKKFPATWLSFIVCCLILIGVDTVFAKTWQIKQGELLNIVIRVPRNAQDIVVDAFGKKWPYHVENGNAIHAWIGVDMETRPGNHPLTIKGGFPDGKSWLVKNEIHVLKAGFPVSHIHVKRAMAEFDARALARIRSDQAALKKTYGMQVNANPAIQFIYKPVSGVISTRFGARRFVNGEPRSPHSGVDIAVPEGTPVRLPLSGQVLLARTMFLNGNTVAIGHGNGLVTVYTHLKKIEVKEGQWLRSGERIGAVGQTGRATGPHLHWGVRYMRARINPLSLFENHTNK
jgi:hypothetical protein